MSLVFSSFWFTTDQWSGKKQKWQLVGGRKKKKGRGRKLRQKNSWTREGCRTDRRDFGSKSLLLRRISSEENIKDSLELKLKKREEEKKCREKKKWKQGWDNEEQTMCGQRWFLKSWRLQRRAISTILENKGSAPLRMKVKSWSWRGREERKKQSRLLKFMRVAVMMSSVDGLFVKWNPRRILQE